MCIRDSANGLQIALDCYQIIGKGLVNAAVNRSGKAVCVTCIGQQRLSLVNIVAVALDIGVIEHGSFHSILVGDEHLSVTDRLCNGVRVDCVGDCLTYTYIGQRRILHRCV